MMKRDFQAEVQPWLLACFGPEIAGDREERNHRFLEEALELVQACGCTASEAHQLVDYVFGRPIGEPRQEAGGVMVTLAALCLANALDMHEAGWAELQRIWTKVEQIRAKQAAKPKHSPLPECSVPSPLILDFTSRELAVVDELAADQELSTTALMRQALRLYQLAHVRLKAGERMQFSGDPARAAEFSGLSLPLPDENEEP